MSYTHSSYISTVFSLLSKSQPLKVHVVKALDPQRFAKRSRESADGAADGGGGDRGDVGGGDDDDGDTPASRRARGGEKPLPSCAADVVCPWHRVEYAAQLLRKHAAMVRALRLLPEHMRRAANLAGWKHREAFRSLPWLSDESLSRHDGVPCHLAPVVPSPEVWGYRNKCEFTCGRDVSGRICLGFQLGQVRLGRVALGEACEPPCPNVPKEMLAAVAIVQAAIRSSKFEPYEKLSGSGCWRQLTARQSFGGPEGSPPALLLILHIRTAGLSTEEEAILRDELERLVASLVEAPLTPPSRISLAVQVVSFDLSHSHPCLPICHTSHSSLPRYMYQRNHFYCAARQCKGGDDLE